MSNRAKITIQEIVDLQITGDEARALDGIFGYDVEVFLRVFKERMGAAYVRDYEHGVRSLHKTIRGKLAGPLAELQDVRRKINEALTE